MGERVDYLKHVRGLWIPADANHSRIERNLSEFISRVPGLAEELKSELFGGETANFASNMEATLALLRDIHARWLALEAEQILKAAKRNSFDVCKKLIIPFITNLLSLSIEIQTFQSRSSDDEEGEQSRIEAHTECVNNLAVVERLIAGGEREVVISLLREMDMPQDSPTVKSLLTALDKGELEAIGRLVKALRDELIKLIVSFGGSLGKLQRKVLAVDDRPEVLTSVSLALKGHYKVLGAPSGKAALKMLETERPELFLLDIDMPEMNGYQLAIIIRCMDEHATTPIIFLTGNATREHVIKALSAGANDFVVKPVSNTTLLAKVSKYLP